MKILKWVFLLAGFVLFCFSTFQSLFWEARTSREVPPIVGRVGDANEVSLTGSLSKFVIQEQEPVRFWLTVHNRTKLILSDFRLKLDAPGYEAISLCVSQDHENYCWARSQVLVKYPDAHLLAGELKPGQSMTIWGDLVASLPSKRQTLYAVLGWIDPGKIPSQFAVALGESVVQTAWQQWIHAVRQFFKDFGLPLALVVLGLVYQWWEKERAQVAQTWNAMLPRSHELTTKYYMPLEAAVRSALYFMALSRQELEKTGRFPPEAMRQLIEWTKGQPIKKEKTGRFPLEAMRRAFFGFLIFEKRFRSLINDVGGFYFKSRVGEKLAVFCYEKYRVLSYWPREDTKRLVDRLVKNISVDETTDTFLEKFLGTYGDESVWLVLQQGWDFFGHWLASKNSAEGIGCLKGLRAVLEYEMNRPYRYWYQRPETLDLDDETSRILEKLAAEKAKEPELRHFPQEVKDYLQSANANRP